MKEGAIFSFKKLLVQRGDCQANQCSAPWDPGVGCGRHTEAGDIKNLRLGVEDILGLGVLRTVVSTNIEMSGPGYPGRQACVCVSTSCLNCSGCRF